MALSQNDEMKSLMLLLCTVRISLRLINVVGLDMRSNGTSAVLPTGRKDILERFPMNALLE